MQPTTTQLSKAKGAAHPTRRHPIAIHVMTTNTVERIIKDARLLARRDSTVQHPCVDWSIEDKRQQLLEMYFQWQDGCLEWEALHSLAHFLKKCLDRNALLLKYEQEYGIED